MPRSIDPSFSSFSDSSPPEASSVILSLLLAASLAPAVAGSGNGAGPKPMRFALSGPVERIDDRSSSPPECAGTVLCLHGGRFRVEVDWTDFEGGHGRGHAVGHSAETGFFWFFDEENLELMVKILDGRERNGHWWVFYGGLSNVEFDLEVTDAETGETWRHENQAGSFASGGDTLALAEGDLEDGGPKDPHVVWDQRPETIDVDDDLFLAFNNTRLAARDETGDLHAVWSRRGEPRYGCRDATTGVWSQRALPTWSGGTTNKVSIEHLGSDLLLAAWTEAVGRRWPAVVTYSEDGGRTWSDPEPVSSAEAVTGAVSLHAWRQADGSPRATLAWVDRENPTTTTGSILVSRWKDDAWLEPVRVDDPAAGGAADPTVFGRDDEVWASWEAGDPTLVFTSQSANGGVTWTDPEPIGIQHQGPPSFGGDPSGCIDPAGTVYLAYQGAAEVFMARAFPGGELVSVSLGENGDRLGEGLFAHVDCNDSGVVGATWERFPRESPFTEDDQKRIGLALSFDGFGTVEAPAGFPVDERRNTQASIRVSETIVDVFWLDVDESPTALKHLAGRISRPSPGSGSSR